jgi:hypothetical protein
MGGVCDGHGAANHDQGADSEGGIDGPAGHAGGVDRACICDTHDGGSSANRGCADTGGGGDPHDGPVAA